MSTRAWSSSIKLLAVAGSKGCVTMFVREICAAAVLIILTLWLQCGGIATFITMV